MKLIPLGGIIKDKEMREAIYKTQDVCRACGVTPRALDYWVERKIIKPSATTGRGKKYFLFSFEDMVQVKIIKGLRDAGISLKKVITAIEVLRRSRGTAWQSAWLVTDGRGVYEVKKDSRIVESLTRGEVGQFVFSLVAIGATQDQVRSAMAKFKCQPIDLARYSGPLRWRKAAAAG